jgi:hypothetical protein
MKTILQITSPPVRFLEINTAMNPRSYIIPPPPPSPLDSISLLTCSPTSVAHRRQEQEQCKHRNQNKFWLDLPVLFGISGILSEHGYMGELLEIDADRFRVREFENSDSFSLPHHVATMVSYTEKECRYLIRGLAYRIQTLHRKQLTHRNLHINNVRIDSLVSTMNSFAKDARFTIYRAHLARTPSLKYRETSSSGVFSTLGPSRKAIRLW